MTWEKPPKVVYTATQVRDRCTERDAALHARTSLRTDESVSEAMALLHELLSSSERRELSVNLTWLLRDSDQEVLHTVHPYHWLNVNFRRSVILRRGWIDRNVLILNCGGLYESLANEWFTSRRFPQGVQEISGNWCAREITPDDYAHIVRKYQLMPSQLQFLINAFKAPYRTPRSD
jgi:hypothetical protein